MGLPSAVLLRTQSDERLVALARDGHERAFETIVRRYRAPLLAACRRICADGRGEDVLQQALLSAWSGLRRGDDVRDLRAWLYRIVRNAAVSHRRRSGHDGLELVDTLSIAPSPEEEAERREIVQETLEAIAELPDRQREALLRIAVQGHSQDEVAGELGLSAVAVRQLVHRARTALRAAATAVVPLPLVSWAASVGGGDGGLAPRVAGLVAGAGGTGATATLLKAGAVAGVAATAVSAPLIGHHHGPAAPAAVIAPPAVAAATPRPTATPRPAVTAAPHRTAAASLPAPTHAAEPRHDSSGGSATRRSEASSGAGAPRRGGSGGHERGDDRGSGGEDRGSGGDRGSGDDRRSGGDRDAGDHHGSGDDGTAGDGGEHSGDDDAHEAATISAGDDGQDSGDDSRHGGDDERRSAARTPTPTPTPAATTAPTPTPTATDAGGDGHSGGDSGDGRDGGGD